MAAPLIVTLGGLASLASCQHKPMYRNGSDMSLLRAIRFGRAGAVRRTCPHQGPPNKQIWSFWCMVRLSVHDSRHKTH